MKTKIIAEAGVNHNGNKRTAYRLVDIAKKAGADYIKFQIFNPNKVVTSSAKLAKYQKNKNKKINFQLELIKELELSRDDFIEISKYCSKKKIKFLATPFDMDSLDFLIKDIKVNLIKVSSGDLTNFPLIFNIGKFQKEIILSLGMSNFSEIEDAIKVYICGLLKSNKKLNYKLFKKIIISDYRKILAKKLTLMHCNTAYPTPVEDANLGNIDLLRKRYPFSKLGFSDHTENINVSILSLSKEINYLEKHFTLNKKMKGPDHSSSLSPLELNKLVNFKNIYYNALNQKKKNLTKSEFHNIKIVRRGLYAAKQINKGEVFTEDNLIFKRPENNYFKNINYWKLLGKKSKKKYSTDDKIRENIK